MVVIIYNEDKLKVNRDIDADKVLLISAIGENLGVMSLEKALQVASMQNLDLIEKGKQSDGVVICKMANHGKLLFDKSKKKFKKSKEKEIQLTTKTEHNDLETKIHKCLECLNKGYSVRIRCTTKGRVVKAWDTAHFKINNFLDKIQEKESISIMYPGSVDEYARTIICIVQIKNK